MYELARSAQEPTRDRIVICGAREEQVARPERASGWIGLSLVSRRENSGDTTLAADRPRGAARTEEELVEEPQSYPAGRETKPGRGG